MSYKITDHKILRTELEHSKRGVYYLGNGISTHLITFDTDKYSLSIAVVFSKIAENDTKFINNMIDLEINQSIIKHEYYEKINNHNT